MVAL
jgi:hypothetical protein